MTTKEIRISLSDVDGDKKPDVLVELYDNKEITFSSFVTASKNPGPFDTVKVKVDVDGDGETDEADDKLLLQLANTAAELLK